MGFPRYIMYNTKPANKAWLSKHGSSYVLGSYAVRCGGIVPNILLASATHHPSVKTYCNCEKQFVTK